MITRTRRSIRLATLARPALIASATLLVAGSGLAAAGVPAGWVLYLAGYASLAVTLPALAAAHGARLGRFGIAAFTLATVDVILGIPVVAMVMTYALGLDEAHAVLMTYALTPVGMIAALSINLALVLVGVAIVRAGVFPPAAGWLVVVGAIAEFPVELGLAPLPAATLALAVAATGFGLIARSLAADQGPVLRAEAA